MPKAKHVEGPSGLPNFVLVDGGQLVSAASRQRRAERSGLTGVGALKASLPEAQEIYLRLQNLRGKKVPSDLKEEAEEARQGLDQVLIATHISDSFKPIEEAGAETNNGKRKAKYKTVIPTTLVAAQQDAQTITEGYVAVIRLSTAKQDDQIREIVDEAASKLGQYREEVTGANAKLHDAIGNSARNKPTFSLDDANFVYDRALELAAAVADYKALTGKGNVDMVSDALELARDMAAIRVSRELDETGVKDAKRTQLQATLERAEEVKINAIEAMLDDNQGRRRGRDGRRAEDDARVAESPAIVSSSERTVLTSAPQPGESWDEWKQTNDRIIRAAAARDGRLAPTNAEVEEAMRRLLATPPSATEALVIPGNGKAPVSGDGGRRDATVAPTVVSEVGETERPSDKQMRRDYAEWSNEMRELAEAKWNKGKKSSKRARGKEMRSQYEAWEEFFEETGGERILGGEPDYRVWYDWHQQYLAEQQAREGTQVVAQSSLPAEPAEDFDRAAFIRSRGYSNLGRRNS